jgi:hypothetical protein
MGNGKDRDGYIIEYIALGRSMKVTAFDPETMLEATVVAPTNLSQKELSDLAIRKLHYLLRTKKNKK